MVSIHRVSVDVLLIISVVCFIFRFKCGDDFRLSTRRLWNDLTVINDTMPHTWIVWGYMHQSA